MTSFTIEMSKITKDRPRVTFKGKRPHTYTPEATHEAEDMILMAYRAAGGVYHGADCPIQVDFVAHIRIPKKYARKYKPGNLAYQLENKDRDNIDKLILDALQPPKEIKALAKQARDGGKELLSGYAYYNDAQVCTTDKIRKVWTDGPTRIDVSVSVPESGW